MKIEKHDIDQLNATVSITIEKSDYLDKYQQELKKTQKNIGLKGFRKGKTPMGMVRKLYGKAFLVDAVNEQLQKAITDYLSNAEFKILGQPIETEDGNHIEWDPNKPEDYVFKFEIGLEPEFEVKGVSEEDEYERQIPKIEDDKVEEELETLQKRAGIQVDVEDQIQKDDMLSIESKELENGLVKEGGHEMTLMVMVSTLTEKYQEEVMKLKQGDKFNFDVTQLEKDRDEKYINKYLLNLKDDETYEGGNDFEGTIQSVKRLKPADLDQKFFDATFGEQEKITDEDAAREKLKGLMSSHYESIADGRMFTTMRDQLIEKNPMELPEKFLKRWLNEANEEMTEEKIEEQFEDFIKLTKWDIIKSKLARQYDLKNGEEEIKQAVINKVFQQYGQYGLPQDSMMQLAKRALDSQDFIRQASDELIESKVFGKIKENIKIVDEVLDLETFEKVDQPAVDEEE